MRSLHEVEDQFKEALERVLARTPARTAPPEGGRVIRNVMDPAFLREQLRTVHAGAPGVTAIPPAAYEEADAELAAASADPGRKASFMPRTATNSILQSVLSTCIESRADQLLADLPEGLDRIAHAVLSDVGLFRDFGPCDIGWISTKVAEGLAMLEGRPAFPDAPAAPVRLAPDARIVIVGDWGTGLRGAVTVAEQMRARLAEGGRREQHVIHLGDVYYSGWREEYETRFLPHWPVDRDNRDVMCWALNGNHDMYSGGHGYFGFLLHDPRFRGHWRGDPAKQTPSSYFSLENDHWQILGLDSGYLDHDLAGSQAQWLAEKLKDGRRRMLLTHHQPFSAYDPSVSQGMSTKVQAAVPADHPLEAWIWGHEHRCTVYGGSPKPYLRFGSCVGNGGVPQLLPDPPLATLPNDPGHAPLTWAYDGNEAVEGDQWLRFGFAVLDFNGAELTIRYIDERNNEVNRVTLG